MSCMTGTPSIMPRVARSRRIWTNSFQTIERRRPRFIEPPRRKQRPLPREPARDSRVPLLELDEDVLERHASSEAGAHLGWGALRLEVAAREERQPVEPLRLVHVMGGDDDGGALRGEPADDAPEQAPRGRVHARGRLVEEQDARVVKRGAPEAEALLLAAREHGDDPAGDLLELHPLERPSHAGGELALQPVDPAVEAQVLLDREVAIEPEGLRHVADDGLDPLGLAGDVDPADRGRPLGRREQAAQHADGRGLARAVGAEDAEDLAGGDVERDAVHRREVAEALGEALDLDGRVPVRPEPRHRPAPSGAASIVASAGRPALRTPPVGSSATLTPNTRLARSSSVSAARGVNSDSLAIP